MMGSTAPEILKAGKGGFTLRVRSEAGVTKTLHSLYDPVEEARRLVAKASLDPAAQEGVFVILGLGLGYHVAELARRLPRAVLVIVESEPAILDAARSLGLLDGLPAGVRFVVGQPPSEALRAVTRAQLEANMAPLGFFCLPSALAAFPGYYGPIVRALEKSVSVRIDARLRYAKFRHSSATVLLMGFPYFLSREIERALETLGHRTIKVPVSKGEAGEVIVARFIEAILAHKPDFLLTVNHLGFDEEGVLTGFFRSIEMPVASWFVDSPELIVKGFAGNVSPLCSIFVWDRSYVEPMKRMGFEDVHYLPLAADETVFRPIRLSTRQRRACECDVGFVASSMIEAVEKWFGRLRPELRSLADAWAKDFAGTRQPMEAFCRGRPEQERRLVEGLSAKERMDFEAAVLWKATMIYRLSCLEALRGFDLSVRGDAGWAEILDPQVRRLPRLDYYRELPLFYNACKINLNATSLQMPQAVNQRVFDVPACGAFLLADRQEALEELFVPGLEVIAFEEPDELPDLVRHYLARPEERARIALRGRERVLADHTYRKRLAALIERMRARYA